MFDNENFKLFFFSFFLLLFFVLHLKIYTFKQECSAWVILKNFSFKFKFSLSLSRSLFFNFTFTLVCKLGVQTCFPCYLVACKNFISLLTFTLFPLIFCTILFSRDEKENEKVKWKMCDRWHPPRNWLVPPMNQCCISDFLKKRYNQK